MEKLKIKLNSSKIPWKMVLCTIGFAAFLPEYIAMFFTLATFVIFKIHYSIVDKRVKMGTVGKAFFAYMCYMLISAIWSDTPIFSFFVALLWMGMFLGDMFVANLVTTKRMLNTAIFYLTVGAAAVGLVGIFQVLFKVVGVNFPNPLYRDFDAFIFRLLPFEVVTEYLENRACGTFNNALILATFLCMVFPLAVYSFFACRNKTRRIISAVCIFIIIGGIASTYSRGAFLAVLAGGLVLAFLGKRKMMTLAIFFLSIIALLPKSIYERIATIGDLDSSATMRIDIWKACLTVFTERPILGLGAGSRNIADFLQNRFSIGMVHAHNLYIELLTEGGIVGFLFLIAVIILIIRDLVKLYKKGARWRLLAVSLAASLTSFGVMSLTEFTLQSPKELQFFMIVLGFVEAGTRISQKASNLKEATECNDTIQESIFAQMS